MELIDRDALYYKLDSIGGCGAAKDTAGLMAGTRQLQKPFDYWKLHLLLNPITVKITVNTKQLKGGELDEFR